MASLGPRKAELQRWFNRMADDINMTEAERQFETFKGIILDRQQRLKRLDSYERKASSRLLSAIRRFDLARIEATIEANLAKQ